MDLNQVSAFVATPALGDWRPGDAWLAGGTWLFSEPQPGIERLLDLTTLGWPALVAGPDGLEIAATCTIAELRSWPGLPGTTAGPLIRQCCEAFLASFKVWNEATVGGNLCNALPAGPMIALTAALDGVCLIQGPSGERTVRAADFVVGDNRHVLRPGEWLRSIYLPAAALRGRHVFRRQSLNTHGRSAALLIGTARSGREWVLTVTASVKHPVQLRFSGDEGADEVRRAVLQAVPDELGHDDVHGLPAWRRHLTLGFAEEIRQELVQ
ncbi:FAD binding domain-containing protein [Kineosporia rhizophila]|uniref:FAD binding domain-containing protein n=1 Tax=Kineosporia rhizophila TaxID=84633 RepID=UPI001E5CEC8C|nr:FAD binding domain-containing protein [Kineosporia rhizophila]